MTDGLLLAMTLPGLILLLLALALVDHISSRLRPESLITNRSRSAADGG